MSTIQDRPEVEPPLMRFGTHFAGNDRNMRRRFALIASFAGVILVGIATGVFAQNLADPNDVTLAVARAFETGDSRVLAKLLTDQVELDLGEGASVYSRDQARFVFTSFFEDHPPSNISLGEPSVLDDLCTARGRYASLDSNQPWDVFIRLGSSKGAWRLKEVRLSHNLPALNQMPAPLTPQLPHR